MPRGTAVNKRVSKIQSFPEIPTNYKYFDYARAARELDEVIFKFAENPTALLPSYIASDPSSWQPLGYWLDQPRQPPVYNPLETGYLKRTFGLPTYVGDNRVLSSGSEAMTTIAAVLGSSFVGIDKSAQSFADELYDFVEMTFSSYDTGTKLVHNYGVQGQSFWYDLFPQIMFARLYDMYPDTPFMREIVLNGADEWLESLPYFVKDEQPKYEFVGYNVVLESPTLIGGHIEPPNGGLAYIFYSAYEMTNDEKYLDGAKEVLDYLQTYQKNPNYEALTDYAPYVAAMLNFKYGTDYDIGKFIDFLFDGDSSFRPGWSVMSGSLGGHPVDGLVGQGGDYAFAMNSYHLATTLVPLIKYDPRYTSDVGRYMLNLVNNAKLFAPQTHDLSHQSMDSYLPFDLSGSLVYEGFRNSWNSTPGYAMGDATTMFGQPSDLSVYSSAFLGGLGSIVSETNVTGILRLNLNATDGFKTNDWPAYAYYNPYSEERVIEYDGGEQSYDLYDITSKSIFARNVAGSINLAIPAHGSIAVVQLPANSVPYIEDDKIRVMDEDIAQTRPAINISNIQNRQEITSATSIEFATEVPLDDQVVSMSIHFNDIELYNGTPLESFQYDKSLLPDTDYTLKVTINTLKGLTDYATKRVICH